MSWHDLELTVEVEAKAKKVAAVKLKNGLERQRKSKKNPQQSLTEQITRSC